MDYTTTLVNTEKETCRSWCLGLIILWQAEAILFVVSGIIQFVCGTTTDDGSERDKIKGWVVKRNSRKREKIEGYGTAEKISRNTEIAKKN